MDPAEIARLVAELQLSKKENRPIVRIPDMADPNNHRRLANVVVGKIFDSRVVNRETLRINLPRILQIRREADIEIVGDNLFAISFGSAEDRRRALHDGPWNFFKSLLVFKELRGLQHPNEIKFDEFVAWVQLHNLPIACMVPATVRSVGEQIGRALEVDINEGGSCLGQFARVRVARPIEEPLQRCVMVAVESGEEDRMVLIRYERLPDFCSACGRVGHVMRHCYDESVDKTEYMYGHWLRAGRVADSRRQRNAGPSRSPRAYREESEKASGGSSSTVRLTQSDSRYGGGRCVPPVEMRELQMVAADTEGGKERESVMLVAAVEAVDGETELGREITADMKDEREEIIMGEDGGMEENIERCEQIVGGGGGAQIVETRVTDILADVAQIDHGSMVGETGGGDRKNVRRWKRRARLPKGRGCGAE